MKYGYLVTLNHKPITSLEVTDREIPGIYRGVYLPSRHLKVPVRKEKFSRYLRKNRASVNNISSNYLRFQVSQETR